MCGGKFSAVAVIKSKYRAKFSGKGNESGRISSLIPRFEKTGNYCLSTDNSCSKNCVFSEILVIQIPVHYKGIPVQLKIKEQCDLSQCASVKSDLISFVHSSAANEILEGNLLPPNPHACHNAAGESISMTLQEDMNVISRRDPPTETGTIRD
ncbi:hypothetical protein NPIL_315051 [Nephila pilipes]|uniref:Uncharacterized protein n=1 Tax=Nephila pilipes TaxID=299642 RepID=A0A8X6TLY5_NEPPI|nr:hypothetical protein NPIL_315051 [Nephila pilipes]